jgi:hypothetical protein
MTKHFEITLEILTDLLEYDKNTGNLFQKKKRPKIQVGNLAGVVTPKGYRYIQLLGKKYASHRLVWFIEYGKFPDLFIDHIDGNKLNNHISNLREVSNKQNTENRGAQKNNKLGRKGVYFNKKLKKYVAQIQHHGVNHYLGVYKTSEEASLMYQTAAKILFSHYKNQ